MSMPQIQRKLLVQIFAISFAAVLCLMAIVFALQAHRLSVTAMRVLIPLPWIAAFVGTYFAIKRYRRQYASLAPEEQSTVDAYSLVQLRKSLRMIWIRLIIGLIGSILSISELQEKDGSTRIAILIGLIFWTGYSIYRIRAVKKSIARLEAKTAQSAIGETA